MHDVYAYGVIAPSTLIELIDDFPRAGGYAEIATAHPSVGGEAAAGAYVLARLGVGTKLAGNRLGADEASTRARNLLSSAGVDCTAIGLEPDVSPVTEIVVTGGADRTVFGTYRKLVGDQDWSEPSRDDVRSSRIACLDPFFGAASQRVADWCVEDGVAYVTIDVAPDSEIARHAAVVIVSQEFLGRALDIADAHEVLTTYVERCSGLVVVTRGERGSVSARPGAAPREHEPFVVDVRDTTGAGDSFRAGIIYGMLHGADDDDMIRTAGALAAMVCRTTPGVLHSPTASELADFLDDAR